MRTALKSVWLVIFAAGLVQTANGLQTDLLGVRAGLEAFPVWALGVIMACYYIGYSAGPLVSHNIVARLDTFAVSSLLCWLQPSRSFYMALKSP